MPFAKHREATLDIELDVRAPALVRRLPSLQAALTTSSAGMLTTQLKLVFVEGELGNRRLELRGGARIDGLAIKRRDGTSLASAERIAVGLYGIDIFGHDARIETVAIDAPVVDGPAWPRHSSNGRVPWPNLHRPLPPQVSGALPEVPWNIRTDKLAITHGTVALADETSTFRSKLIDVALDATNLSTKPGEKAHVKVGFVSSDRIASFSGEADVEPTVPAAAGRFALAKFSLGLLYPFYKSTLAVEVQKGSLDYASAFAFDATGNLRLERRRGDDHRPAPRHARQPGTDVAGATAGAAPDRCRCSRLGR